MPRCLTSLERDRGGLFTLEEMSLLTTVFAKVEAVLLARNLKSYKRKTQLASEHQRHRSLSYWIERERIRRPKAYETYSQKQVKIKIRALCVSLVSILDSSSLNQVNAL